MILFFQRYIDKKKKIFFSENEGSGWKFKKFLQWDVRYVEVNPENMIRYGHTPPSPPLAYDHRIKSLFFRMIVDPTRYMKEGLLRQNFCVLAGVIISIRTAKRGSTPSAQ